MQSFFDIAGEVQLNVPSSKRPMSTSVGSEVGAPDVGVSEGASVGLSVGCFEEKK